MNIDREWHSYWDGDTLVYERVGKDDPMRGQTVGFFEPYKPEVDDGTKGFDLKSIKRGRRDNKN